MSPYFFAAAKFIKENKPFAAAVLCEEKYVISASKALNALENFVYVPKTNNPVEVDIILADALEKALPSNITACAAVFAAWKKGPVSGSVIGNPHSEGSSADNETDEIAPNLWCSAFAGGPGFIAEGKRQTALKLREIINTHKNLHTDPWEDFYVFAKKEGIPSFIYADDACGKDGMLFVKAQNGEWTERF